MDNVKVWLENKCPLFGLILTSEAKDNMPRGVIEFLSSGYASEIERGKEIFLLLEKYLETSTQKISINEISNKYGRELSNVGSEKQLSEIVAEISVCATISKVRLVQNKSWNGYLGQHISQLTHSLQISLVLKPLKTYCF
jgi:hypothetical protein